MHLPDSQCPTVAAAACVAVDPLRYRMTVRISSPSQLAQLAAMVARALDHGEYEPGMEVRVDCRGCVAPDSPTIRALAGSIAESRDVLGPVAILTDNPACFGMGRMLEILVGLRGDSWVRVFRQEPQLESWLRQTGVAGRA